MSHRRSPPRRRLRPSPPSWSCRSSSAAEYRLGMRQAMVIALRKNRSSLRIGYERGYERLTGLGVNEHLAK